MSAGYVYALSNPSMPGLIKIGMTKRVILQDRVDELFSTSVPTPFEVIGSVWTDKPSKVEAAVHNHLFKFRVHAKKEFFRMDGDEAFDAIKTISKPLTDEDIALYEFEEKIQIEIDRENFIADLVERANRPKEPTPFFTQSRGES